MKKSILLIVFVFLAFNILYSQVSKIINVSIPGTLNNLVSDEEKSSITDLIITGTINYDDYAIIRQIRFLNNLDLGAVHTAGDSIPYQAFIYGNPTKIIIPADITRIGVSAFENCNRLAEINMPSTVTSIGDRAFFGCHQLPNISLPPSLVTIGNQAFVYCIGSTSIDFPPSLISLGWGAFNACNGLTVVHIPSTLISIGELAFDECSNLNGIVVDDDNINYSSIDSVLFNKNKTTLIKYPSMKTGGVYSIPTTVDTIKSRAFASLKNLISLEITASVKYIGSRAISSGTKLNNIMVDESNENYSSKDGVLFDKNQQILIHYPVKRSDIFYEIPSSVKLISEHAFYNATNLISVILPNSIKKISEYAFILCNKLDSINIPQSVISIGKNAFAYCTSLKAVTIQPSITSISPNVFFRCSALTSISIPSSIEAIGNHAFTYCLELDSIKTTRSIPLELVPEEDYFMDVDMSSCTLYVPEGSSSNYRASAHWGNFTNIVEYSFKLSLSEDSVTLRGGYGNIAAFDIVSNTEWSVSSDQPWLSLSDSIGLDNGRITISVSSNTEQSDRIAKVTVSGLGIVPQTIIITQEPSPILNVSSDILIANPSSEGAITFDVISNTEWTATSNQPWLTVDPTTGSGNITITIMTEPNQTNTNREATVTITNTLMQSKMVNVTQQSSQAMAVENSDLKSFTVHPNPSSDLIYIEGALGDIINIFDTQGRFRMSKRIDRNCEVIDISSLPRGTYFIQFDNEVVKIIRL